jgi:Flp pilus assembly protein TadG
MTKLAKSVWRDDRGAVAPLVALSLVALIAVGGVAFDYARLAAMDTELQDAADHAALAAATQLDGKVGAQDRATQAAEQLITNQTRFARTDTDHDASVGVAHVTFYADYVSASSFTAASGDEDSTAVQVEVDTRTADFAFTPIAGALHGSLAAKAVAGVSSAVCGVVPFFICSPSEPATNTDLDAAADVTPGIGIKMMEGGDQKGPGNFGFLAYAGTGAKNLEEALSKDSLKDECVSANPAPSVQTEPGQKESVFDGINNRFDVVGSCSSPPCSPSTNERKDLVRQAGSCNWKQNPATAANYPTKLYRPTTAAVLDPGVTPEIMGFPRDLCHATNAGANCPNGLIGNGQWDRAAYFRSNHPTVNWLTDPDLGPNVSRYQTYLWEADPVSPDRLAKKDSSTAGWSAYSTPQAGVCKFPGIAPNANGIDRRRLTAAVVNCHAYGKINGRKTIPVAGYIDVFLVEPSKDRTLCDGNQLPCKTKITNRDDIYVEAIGVSGTGQGGAIPQITRRSVPRLIE